MADLEAAITVEQKGSDCFYHVGRLLGLGLAFMLLGDTAQAISFHVKLLDITEKHGEMVCRGRSATSGGWARWQEGDPAQARTVLEQGIRLSGRARDPGGLARSIQTLAWVEADQNNADRAAVLLGAADGIWREIGGSPASYFSELIYHQECEQHTRRALGNRLFDVQFQRGAAFGMDDAVDYALGQQSHAPREISPQPSQLTRREQQVAALVAEGLTNKAIGLKLVISLRTAQGHVEHILTKLGFTSRAQIAAWFIETERESEEFNEDG